MKTPGKQQMFQAASCLLCVVWVLSRLDDLGASEFGGGQLTGPLWRMFDNGWHVYLVALLVTFVYPRIAAVIALAASSLCLPLYLYFMAPVPFTHIFGRGLESSVHWTAGLQWNPWAIIGELTLVVADYV